MLKHTKTSVKKMNRNVNGLKTYIIKKKKKNSFGSLLWKNVRLKTGKNGLSTESAPGVVGMK